MTVPQILKQLQDATGSNEKKRILAETKSVLMGMIFQYAYDPFMTYGVHKLKPEGLTYSATPDSWWEDVFVLLEKLKARELTGNAAKDAIADIMSKADKEHSDVIPLILKRDLRIGIGASIINKVYEGLLPEDFCMSANKYDKKRVTYPVYADTKLDGVRCIAVVDHEIKLFSRNAKEFKNYSTIEVEIGLLGLPRGTKLDGEITMGHFQDLMRTVSRREEGIELAKDAVYNVFDVPDDNEFAIRASKLGDLHVKIEELGLKHIKIVTGKIIADEIDLLDFYQSQLDLGEEGIMIKTFDGKYEFKRGWGWQKMKPEHTDDLEVIGSVEGEGKYKGQLGVIVCRLENGGEVRVGSGFKDEEREDLWKKRELLVGQVAEVKYQEKTKDGSLRFPIFIRFRPDKV